MKAQAFSNKGDYVSDFTTVPKAENMNKIKNEKRELNVQWICVISW